MVIILGKGHDVPLWSDLKPAASADLDIRTLKLPDHWAISLEDRNVETVAMTVANQNIPSITDINTIGEVGDVLAADATQEMSILIKHHNTMALKRNEYAFIYFVLYFDITH